MCAGAGTRTAAVHLSGCGSFLTLCPSLPWGPEALRALQGGLAPLGTAGIDQGSRSLGWSFSCLLLSMRSQGRCPIKPRGCRAPSSHSSSPKQLQSLERPLSTRSVASVSLRTSSRSRCSVPLPPPTLCCLGLDLRLSIYGLSVCPSLVHHPCLNLTLAMVSRSPLY